MALPSLAALPSNQGKIGIRRPFNSTRTTMPRLATSVLSLTLLKQGNSSLKRNSISSTEPGGRKQLVTPSQRYASEEICRCLTALQAPTQTPVQDVTMTRRKEEPESIQTMCS